MIGNNKVSGIHIAMALIVILSFLFNSLVSSIVVLNPKQFNSQSRNISQVISEKVLICTSDGLKWVDAQELIADNEQNPSSNHKAQNHCPFLKYYQQQILLLQICCFLIYLALVIIQSSKLFEGFTARLNKLYLSCAPKQSPPAIS